jgi:hypothetical protein
VIRPGDHLLFAASGPGKNVCPVVLHTTDPKEIDLHYSCAPSREHSLVKIKYMCVFRLIDMSKCSNALVKVVRSSVLIDSPPASLSSARVSRIHSATLRLPIEPVSEAGSAVCGDCYV